MTKKIVLTDEEIVRMINERKAEIAQEIERERLQKSVDNLIKRARRKGFMLEAIGGPPRNQKFRILPFYSWEK
jgi:chromosome condensin MukBEF MukE localization factor